MRLRLRCVTICYSDKKNTIDVVPTFQGDGGYYIVNSEENKENTAMENDLQNGLIIKTLKLVGI